MAGEAEELLQQGVVSVDEVQGERRMGLLGAPGGSYVGNLQTCVDRQLEASDGEQAREAEDAFFWVTHYERGFWDMAMSG